MAKRRPSVPTTPQTCPTVCIMAAGSFDLGIICTPNKKNTTANNTRTRPPMINRKFLGRTKRSTPSRYRYVNLTRRVSLGPPARNT
jgi:hypothetical protein